MFDLRCTKGAREMLEAVADSMRKFQRCGFEIVPLDDVIEFVRERRYLPRKCLGLVIEVGNPEELSAIEEALPGLHVVVLLPLGALETCEEPKKLGEVSSSISLGIDLVGGPEIHDAARFRNLIGSASAKAVALTGIEPRYVRVAPAPDIELRGVLRGTPYSCILNGRGFNRFGDEAHLLRLLDTTTIIEGRRAGKNLLTYVGLFKGKYYLWPVAAALKHWGSGPEGT